MAKEGLSPEEEKILNLHLERKNGRGNFMRSTSVQMMSGTLGSSVKSTDEYKLRKKYANIIAACLELYDVATYVMNDYYDNKNGFQLANLPHYQSLAKKIMAHIEKQLTTSCGGLGKLIWKQVKQDYTKVDVLQRALKHGTPYQGERIPTIRDASLKERFEEIEKERNAKASRLNARYTYLSSVEQIRWRDGNEDPDLPETGRIKDELAALPSAREMFFTEMMEKYVTPIAEGFDTTSISLNFLGDSTAFLDHWRSEAVEYGVNEARRALSKHVISELQNLNALNDLSVKDKGRNIGADFLSGQMTIVTMAYPTLSEHEQTVIDKNIGVLRETLADTPAANLSNADRQLVDHALEQIQTVLVHSGVHEFALKHFAKKQCLFLEGMEESRNWLRRQTVYDYEKLGVKVNNSESLELTFDLSKAFSFFFKQGLGLFQNGILKETMQILTGVDEQGRAMKQSVKGWQKYVSDNKVISEIEIDHNTLPLHLRGGWLQAVKDNSPKGRNVRNA